MQEETGAVRFEVTPICVYSVTGKNRVNDTGEETFGLLCFAEITEFAKELHSEMEKVVLMDELPNDWTYPLIQPQLIEKYLQVKNICYCTLKELTPPPPSPIIKPTQLQEVQYAIYQFKNQCNDNRRTGKRDQDKIGTGDHSHSGEVRELADGRI